MFKQFCPWEGGTCRLVTSGGRSEIVVTAMYSVHHSWAKYSVQLGRGLFAVATLASTLP